VDNVPAFDPSPESFGAKRTSSNLRPIAELSAENCAEQMGVPALGIKGCRTIAWASRPVRAGNCKRGRRATCVPTATRIAAA